MPKFSDVGHAGHYVELTGPFTDKRGHWPKKFVSDEPFELILSYEIVVTSPVTIAEFSVCHKDDFTDIMLCRDGIYKMRCTTQNALGLTKRSERLCVSTS